MKKKGAGTGKRPTDAGVELLPQNKREREAVTSMRLHVSSAGKLDRERAVCDEKVSIVRAIFSGLPPASRAQVEYEAAAAEK